MRSSCYSVVDRFRAQINWVSRSVAKSFCGDIEISEVRQEALLLVLSYGGAVREGWHNGKLAEWERLSRGDEAQVKALLARTLRLDLSRLVGRRVTAEPRAVPLDRIPLGEEPSFDDFEDAVIGDIEGDVRALRRNYPMLVKRYLDGYSIRQIADAEGISRQAVWARMRRERGALASAYGIVRF